MRFFKGKKANKQTNKKSKTQKWINHRLQLTFPPTPWLLGLSHISELVLGFTLLVAQEGRGWASTTERWCSNCGETKQNKKNTDQAWDSEENPTAVWETFLIKTLSHESRPTVLHAFYFEIKRWSRYNKLCTLQTVCCHAHIILQLPDPFSIAVGQHDEQVRWTLSFSDLWPTVPAEEASGQPQTTETCWLTYHQLQIYSSMHTHLPLYYVLLLWRKHDKSMALSCPVSEVQVIV